MPFRKSKRARTKPPAAETPPKAHVDLTTEAGPQVPSEAQTPVSNVTQDGVNSTEDNIAPLAGGSESSNTKQLQSRSSWYGTWPRKSTASTQVARESILAHKPSNASSADLNKFDIKKLPTPTAARPPSASRPPSMCLGKSKETLDITMGGTLEESQDNQTDVQVNQAPKNNKADPIAKPDTEVPEPVRLETKPASVSDVTAQRPTTASGWLGGWLGWQPTQEPGALDGQTESTETSKVEEPIIEQPEPVIKTAADTSNESNSVPNPEQPYSSWFGLWSSGSASTAPPTTGISTATIPPITVTSSEPPPKEAKPPEKKATSVRADDGDTVMEDAPPTATDSKTQPATGSTWAFWSTEMPKKDSTSSKSTETPGKLAVMGAPSEDRPVAASLEQGDGDNKKDAKRSKTNKRGRPSSSETQGFLPASEAAVASISATTPKTTHAKSAVPNLLLPSVGDTYSLVEDPSFLKQLTRIIYRGNQEPVKHVFLSRETPKIRKVVAIGVHGLFPTPLIRKILGPPTGTSTKFVTEATDAIKRWAKEHGSTGCEIHKISLEFDGKIADRVEFLWKELLNQIDKLRQADYIQVACHSQGVPVSVMLIAKLIELGIINSTTRIGIGAMAGVSLGPFPQYKSGLFGGPTAELFEFADSESALSKTYHNSLQIILNRGVRLAYIGSIDDQLVSMQSSVFAPACHPYIYRAVFVDGRVHKLDFLSHLVGFALKLRNLGVSDHGLIEELSNALAGSLYTGEGHSALYNDPNVYDLAVKFVLQTTSISGSLPDLQIKKYSTPAAENPYLLPWIMRGVLEEDYVKTVLGEETRELIKMFDEWKPTKKEYKVVKEKLEAIRLKL